MRSAALMDVHGESRVFSNQGTRGTSVVQMNVSQQDCIEVLRRQPQGMKLAAETGQRRFRTGIDQHAHAAKIKECRGDGVRPPGPIEVNSKVCGHPAPV